VVVRPVAEYFTRAQALQATGQHAQADAAVRAAQEIFPAEWVLFAGWARFAVERRDWPEAQRRWAEVRVQFPQNPHCYTLGAHAFVEGGNIAAAEELLEQALQACPHASEVCFAWAEIAMRRQDWPQAIERWAIMREQFPHLADGYHQGAAALRSERRYAEAEAVLCDATERFPDHDSLAFEFARNALDLGNWPEARRRSEAFRTRLPGHPFGYISGAQALQELGDTAAAETLLDQAVQTLPADENVLRAWGEMAMRSRDWDTAIERWAMMRDRLPGHIYGYRRCVAALREAQRDAEAEALLQDTTERFPDDLEAALDFARIAHSQYRWSEATARWAQVQARFPNHPAGFGGAALSAREAGRRDEEDRILYAMLEQFPDDFGVASEFAVHAIRASDWPESLRRWELVKLRFPTQPSCDSFLAMALRNMGREDEAATTLTEAMERFPGDLHLLFEAARLARHNRDWAQALDRWNAVRQARPDVYDSFINTALALRELKRFDEADTVLKQAMERFPTDPLAFFDYGMVALSRNDPASAFTRLQDALQKFPNDTNIRNHMLIARERLTELGPDALGVINGRLDLSVDDKLASIAPGLSKDVLRSIFFQFESLGGIGVGCEFGTVQRAFGADPLGLLRWSATFPDQLAEALETRFEGVGLPENINLTISDRGDYWIQEKRFGTSMHTFVNASDASSEQMMQQTSRRLQFLKSKLISDLEAGEKIFLYKFNWHPLADEEISRLHRAIRSYGDGFLLFVQYANEVHSTETVELRAPGLMIGYLDRFVDPDIYDPSPAWGALCLKAHRLWKDSRA
jgi:tetratricopeptide (TPR) repeat protein